VSIIELVIRPRAPYKEMLVVPEPRYRVHTNLPSPCVASVRISLLFQAGKHARQISFAGLLRVCSSQSFCQVPNLGHKTCLIASRVFCVFGVRETTSKLCFKFIAVNQLGRRKQRPRSAILLLEFRLVPWLNDVRHANRMNLIAGLHHLLLEIEEDLCESRL